MWLAVALAATSVQKNHQQIVGRLLRVGTRPLHQESVRVWPGIAATEINLSSVLGNVLLVPQGVIEIEYTLIEGVASWVDTDIGTGETRSHPVALMGTQGAI